MKQSVIYCTSGKGGVGTTLFASNLTYMLAEQDQQRKVLFIDMNRNSDAHYFFGREPKKSLYNLSLLLEEKVDERDMVEVMRNHYYDIAYTYGYAHILFAPHNDYEYSVVKENLATIIKRADLIYDYIIIDGDVEIDFFDSIKQYVHTIIGVTTPDKISVGRTAEYFGKSDDSYMKKKIHIVFNQSDDFVYNEVKPVFDYPVIGALPTDPHRAWDTVMLGKMIALSPKSKYTKAMQKIIKTLTMI